MKLSIAPLFSSSSGNSIYIGSEKTNILLDAGVAGSKIEKSLKEIGILAEKLDGILVSHEHTDHIKSIGVLSRKYDIPIYANEKTWQGMEKKIGPVSSKNIVVIDHGDFYIGEIGVNPYSVSHDGADTFGYSFYHQDKKISIMTDLGVATKKLAECVSGSNIVLLEANHDVEMLKCSKYPYYLKRRILSNKGHLSNEDSAKMAYELALRGVKGILLGHLSRQNNFYELAYQTVAGHLTKMGVVPGKDVALAVAYRDKTTGFFKV